MNELKEVENKVNNDLEEKSIQLLDGTIISNLRVTYRNLFNFQNTYSKSKDLIEALVKKQTFEHETMLQLIYVGYLGTNPNPKMDYLEFIDNISFDFKRDMRLFNELTGVKVNQKN